MTPELARRTLAAGIFDRIRYHMQCIWGQLHYVQADQDEVTRALEQAEEALAALEARIQAEAQEVQS